jgi:hypothetical protein
MHHAIRNFMKLPSPLSLLGVKGYTMAVDPIRFFGLEPHAIERDALLVPEVMIERFEVNPAEVMRSIFDAVWNATGYPRSMNYDDGGKWVGH